MTKNGLYHSRIGHAFAFLLEGSGLSLSPNADFTTLLWRKLLINAVANPLSALTRQRQMVLRRDDMRMLRLAVLEEGPRLVGQKGRDWLQTHLSEPSRHCSAFTDDLGTSMYLDTLAGRQLEVEALTRATVAAGERHGIARRRSIARSWHCCARSATARRPAARSHSPQAR